MLQVGQHGLVGAPAVRVGVPLADVPPGHGGALRPAAAHERREARVARGGGGVLGGVQRVGAQPVLEPGGERLLGGGAVLGLGTGLAQHALDELLPLLTVRGRELGCEGEPFGRDLHVRRLAPVRRAAGGGFRVTFPSIGPISGTRRDGECHGVSAQVTPGAGGGVVAGSDRGATGERPGSDRGAEGRGGVAAAVGGRGGRGGPGPSSASGGVRGQRRWHGTRSMSRHAVKSS